ncbi:hypothetical protein diail_4707 [Diaporthe ilicicola]|nr:hypothetical protein diail_4707 [Diaporthe ilicicola]
MAAIWGVLYQLGDDDFVNHHTLPVVIYSFHGDRAARIIHATWAEGGLCIRQSRPLDMTGSEPTEDAFILGRWMANAPVGDTRYLTPEESGPPDQELDQRQPMAEALAVEA